MISATYPLEEDSFISSSTGFLVQAINDANDDGVVQMNSEAMEVVTKLKNSDLNTIGGDFTRQLSSLMFAIIKRKPNGTADKESITNQFHRLTLDKTLREQWNAVLLLAEMLPSEASNMLYQSVLDSFHLYSVQYRSSTLLTDIKPISDAELKLEPEEEEVLRYVAGYIPYSLKKKYTKLRHLPEGQAILSVLSSWSKEEGEKDMSFLDYTRDWTALRDRGGLFIINDELYIFIRRIENVARTIFNKNLLVQYCNQNLSNELKNQLSASELISEAWEKITRNLENKSLGEKLKMEIFTKWINIRATAFLKAWLAAQRLKIADDKAKSKKAKKSIISEKGAPSLRKSLAPSTSQSSSSVSFRKSLSNN